MILLDEVSKTYRTELVDTVAVASATLEISEGEFLAVTGRSGSGKSTLAAMVGLLEKPSGGRIVFRGEQVSDASSGRVAALRRRHVGFVFQSFHLIPHLRVSRNIELALDGLGLSRAERERRVAEVLDQLGIASRAGHYPRQLSGGQQQRVALARALVRRPSILVCDEPTGNLDSQNSENVVDLLKQAHADGATILIVTHDEKVAEAASRRLWMEDGKIRLN